MNKSPDEGLGDPKRRTVARGADEIDLVSYDLEEIDDNFLQPDSRDLEIRFQIPSLTATAFMEE
jgi:hypothetical protein